MTLKRLFTLLGFMGLALTLVAMAPHGATGLPAVPTGGPQVFLAFTGGSIWTSGTTGTCIWYFPVLGNMPLASLFASDGSGAPVIDKEHAYLIWVSDWNISAMAANPGFGASDVSVAVVPAGTATIYYSDNPLGRDWKLDSSGNFRDRSSWGVPVATFVRGGGLFHSPDGFVSTDKFYFSAPLINSETFDLGGTPFNFRTLMARGMTCFEYGQNYSTTETGSCMALGN